MADAGTGPVGGGDTTATPVVAVSGQPWELPPELEYFRTSPAYRVELPEFYGPLDLLLYLIQKDEIDIYDIPIARITAQYLQYLEVIQALSLDTAGDFIVMAATLMRIKARMLLPRHEETGEELDEEDPRAELVRRLLEYKRFKEMAARFRELGEQRQRYHVRAQRWPLLAENREPPRLKLGMYELLAALANVFERVSREPVHPVERELFTVAEKEALIRKLLAERETVRFDELFRDDAIRMEVIVTFIALLEMARRQEILLMQQEPGGAIWVRARGRAAAAAAGGAA